MTFELLFGVGVAIFLAVALGRRAYQSNKEREALKHQLAACPLLPVSAVQSGRVQIQGNAVPITVNQSPLSSKPVIGLKVKLEKLELQAAEGAGMGGSPNYIWGPMLEVMHMNDFYVNDGSGMALVRAAQCYPQLDPEPVAVLSVEQLLQSPLNDLLRSQRYPEHWLASIKQVRVIEYLVEPGERVFVVGEARRELVPGAGGYRGDEWRVVLAAPLGGWIMISDRPRELVVG